MGVTVGADIATGGSDANPASSGTRLAAILLCGIGFGIDLSEFAIGNALSAIFSAGARPVGAVELALLVGAAYAGAAVGAPIVGRLGDKHGYQRVLVLALVWIGFTTLAGSASGSSAVLTGTRFLAGMALGGYPPLMVAYLGKIARPGRERRIVLMTCAVAYLGPPAMLFGIRWLTPVAPLAIEGWRWALGAAGTMSLVAAAGLQLLPGAVGRLPLRERTDADFPHAREAGGEQTPIAVDHRRDLEGRRVDLIVYAAGYAAVAIATIAFPLVTGPVLLARGISLNDTLLYVGLGSLGPVIGTLVASTFIDRVPRRPALVGAAMSMLVAVLLFFSGSGPIALIASVVTFAIGMALYLPLIAAHGAESFPTGVRGLATSTGWACNRLAAAVAPLLVLPLARSGHALLVEALLCGSLVVAIGLLFGGDSANSQRTGSR